MSVEAVSRAASWDAFYGARASRYPSTEIVRLVARHYPRGGQGSLAMDIGCGAGSHSWLLAREGFRVSGCDLSEVAVAKAMRLLGGDRLSADLIVADVRHLPKGAPIYDLMIDASTLTYLTPDEHARVLDVLATMLRPGGRFFSVMPSVLCSRAPYEAAEDGFDVPCRFWTRKEIVESYGKNFHVDEISDSAYTARCGTAHLLIADMVRA